MVARLGACVLVLAAACEKEAVKIHGQDTGEDYNRSELTAAVSRFVAAGRTPEAFGELVAEVDRLRPGMDGLVADEAELKLTTQALAPVEQLAGTDPVDQTLALATTVWAFALRPPIEARRPEVTPDPVDADLMPRPGEDGPRYLLRVCGGPLAAECKHVVPERQGVIVGDQAVQRLTQRARTAVATCSTCASDPGWAAAVTAWEQLDREAASRRIEEQRRAAPSNWPAAGPAAGPWPDVPRIQLEADGDLILEGVPVPPQERTGELQMLFAQRAAIGLEAPPGTPVESLMSVVADARRGGVEEVIVAARDPAYPWTLRGYRIAAASSGHHIAIRRTDTVQVLLRAIDADAEPGTRVRID
jgi:hypothetical protein